MRFRNGLLVLGCAVALYGCSGATPPVAPSPVPATAPPQPTARVETFGPFFSSSSPPDETCARQTTSWSNDSGRWVTGPRYCTYWPSDPREPEAFSLCVGEWADVIVEANLRYYTRPSRVGIVVRALNPNDAYVFVISQADDPQCYWQVRRGGKDAPLQSPERWSDPIDPRPLVLPRGDGTQAIVARVRVEAQGSRLVGYVNALEASVLEGAPVRKGRVGLYMHNDGTEQSWADVVIRVP